MIILFVCDDNECPNGGIEYRMITEDLNAECGGCHAMLEGVDTGEIFEFDDLMNVPRFD